MRLATILCLLLSGCANGGIGDVGPVGPPRGPFAMAPEIRVSEPPETWLYLERDVILLGQTPHVDVRAEGGPRGYYNEIGDFDVIGPDGEPVVSPCALPQPSGSRGAGALNFSGKCLTNPGVYTVTFDPARLSWPGESATARVRVVDAPPASVPPPNGWTAAPLTSGIPRYQCYGYGESYEVLGNPLQLRALRRRRGERRRIPEALLSRMSSEHAAGVQYVFSSGKGWLVLFNHGEFGGGIEWYSEEDEPPRAIAIGERDDEADYPVQNVNRAVAKHGALYVLQGLSHMVSSDGQLAKLWPEHDHFTSRVIARYMSEPFDWIEESDGSWTIATQGAIWNTTESGTSALVARLPPFFLYATSLLRAADGTIYIGARAGVLRLTPTWSEAPRFFAEFLMPTGSRQERCWRGEVPR